MKLNDGTDAKYGDVIRWNCWDNDDFTTWKMTGVYTRNGVVYLGGGVDFGAAVGKLLEVSEVVSDSENHDCSEACGIAKVGVCSDLARYIRGYGA